MIAALLTTACVASAQSRQQLHFSAEDATVANPVDIPPDVLAILANSDVVKNVMEDENVKQLPASWFVASKVTLHPHESDLVVIGKPPLAGANVTAFWIFRPTTQGYETILDAAPAHDLIVRKTTYHGYQQIELASFNAVELSRSVLRFDRTRYVLFHSNHEQIGNK